MGTIKGYYSQAHRIANTIITILLILEFAFFGIKIAMGEHASLSGILKKICYIGAWLYIANNIDMLAEAFVSTLAKSSFLLGNAKEGTHIDFLANPFEILMFAYENIIQPIIEDLKEALKLKNIWKNTFSLNLVIFILLIIGVIVSFGLITIMVILIQIEFYFVTLCAILLLPFMINEKTKFISEKVIPSITGQGIKLMVMAIVVKVVLATYQLIIDKFWENDDLSFLDSLYLVTIIALGLYIVIQSQTYAQSLISGMPDTNVAKQAMSLGASGLAAYKMVNSAKGLAGKMTDSQDKIKEAFNKHIESKVQKKDSSDEHSSGQKKQWRTK